MIPFGEWAPDVADLNTSVSRTVLNVVPNGNFYGPWKGFQALSQGMAGNVVGGCFARKNDGSLVMYAGTVTKLYRFNSATNGWTDVSRSSGGNYTVPDYWSFAQFGANLIAVNANDAPQVIDVEAGTNFAALAGSPPLARHISVIGDFVVLSGLTNNPNRIQWSGLNDSTGWTPNVNSSDYQDFPDGGPVKGVSGLESGFVIQADAVRLMTFEPTSSAVFSFQRLDDARGSPAAWSIITVGSVTFLYGNDGFYALGNATSKPIGVDRVNNFFRSDVQPNFLTNMVGAIDPRSTRVVWAYASTASASGGFDRLIGYDWGRDRWFLVTEALDYLTGAATIGYTLEGLDTFGSLDALPFSLDSAVWQGGVPALAGWDANHKLGFFDGAPKEAVIETAEVQLAAPGLAFVSGVTPYIDTTQAMVSVGGRLRQQDTLVYGTEWPVGVTGEAPARVSGRFHRSKVRVPAGAAWTKAQGIDASYVPDGMR